MSERLKKGLVRNVLVWRWIALCCAAVLSVGWLPMAHAADMSQDGVGQHDGADNAMLCMAQDDDAPDGSMVEQQGDAGNMPVPGKRCYVAGVHSDVFSMYLTAGEHRALVLKTRADELVPGAGDGTRYDSDTLAFVVPDAAKQATGDLPAQYDFLQRASGNGDIWYLPQTQDSRLLWAGASTEALVRASENLRGSQATLELVGFRGPGQVMLWQDGVEGDIVPLLGSPDSGFPRSHTMQIPQHEHMNWAFTRPGRYALTMQASVTVDGQLLTDTQEYIFIVGEGGVTPGDSRVTAVAHQGGGRTRIDSTVAASDFGNPQGWVSVSDEHGVLAWSRVIGSRASVTLPLADNDVSRLRVQFHPRFAEDMNGAVSSVTMGEPDPSVGAGEQGQGDGGKVVTPKPGSGRNGEGPRPDARRGESPSRNLSDVSASTGVQQQCDSRDMVVLDHGHMDIAAFSPSGRGLRIVVQEDVTGSHVRRDPSSVMIWVRDASRVANAWRVPQTQRSGIPWLGWNNQFLSRRDVPVTWTIEDVRGPGHVRVWMQGNLGRPGETVFDSISQRTYVIHPNTHAHANWDFSAPGYYAFRMRMSSSLGSDVRTVYLTVGDRDPHAMPLPCTVQQSSRQMREPVSSGDIAVPGVMTPSEGERSDEQSADIGDSEQSDDDGVEVPRFDRPRKSGVHGSVDAVGDRPSNMFSRRPWLSALAFVMLGASATMAVMTAVYAVQCINKTPRDEISRDGVPHA